MREALLARAAAWRASALLFLVAGVPLALREFRARWPVLGASLCFLAALMLLQARLHERNAR